MVKTITIVGLGAIGSNLLFAARELPVEWVLVDFDAIEFRNTQAQFHTCMSLRRNKAQALQQVMQSLFKKKNVKTKPVKLTDDNADAVLGGSDLVLDCVDNPEARTIIATYCRDNDIPCLHGGLAQGAPFGQALWDEDFTISAPDENGVATCEAGEFTPFIVMMASAMAGSVQKYLETGEKVGFVTMTPTALQQL